MNPFTQHTQQQGITYFEHLYFAMGIAWRLSSSAMAFAMHAIFPFIDINNVLDLEATTDFLQQRNHWIENAKLERQTKSLTTNEESLTINKESLMTNKRYSNFVDLWAKKI